MNENHAYMKECAAEAARVAQGVRPDRLGDPTPCAEFDLRALVNHLVLYTSHGLERRALREELPDELTKRDFTADAAWPQEYAVQLDRAVAAWADPAVWDGDIGGTPATDTAAMMILEMALHGWDLAAATGQEYSVSAETGAFVLQVVEKYAEMYRQYEGFDGAVPAGPDAPPFRQAVAASGRDPHWRPSAR